MPYVDLLAVRQLVPIQDALEFYGWRPVVCWGVRGTWRGPCPIHHSESPRSRTFQVQPARGVFRCWKCGEHGDVIQLWARLHRLTTYQAALHLCAAFGRRVPYRSC